MSENPTDAIVAAILVSLTTGLNSHGEERDAALARAVSSLRLNALQGDHVISPDARQKLDAAVRAVQPLIVCQGAPSHAPFMLGALHVIIAEWANPERKPSTQASPVVLEAFILARLLDNWLIEEVLTSALRRKRAAMDESEFSSLPTLVGELYPSFGLPSAEPMPFNNVTVH